MARKPPPWRRVFDRAERTVGKPLEDLVASRRYMDVSLMTRKVRGAVGGLVTRPTAAILHVANIPDRADVRRLSRQIATLTNEVRELHAEIEELREPMPTIERPASESRQAAPKSNSGESRSASASRRPARRSGSGSRSKAASQARPNARPSADEQDVAPGGGNDA